MPIVHLSEIINPFINIIETNMADGIAPEVTLNQIKTHLKTILRNEAGWFYPTALHRDDIREKQALGEDFSWLADIITDDEMKDIAEEIAESWISSSKFWIDLRYALKELAEYKQEAINA